MPRQQYRSDYCWYYRLKSPGGKKKKKRGEEKEKENLSSVLARVSGIRVHVQWTKKKDQISDFEQLDFMSLLYTGQ